MTDLSNYSSDKPLKILLMAESGSGKTGALASLAEAGFKLRIQDYDNGIGILAQLLKGKDTIKNVKFETLTDKVKTLPNGMILPDGQPQAFARGLSLLDHWKTPTEDLGKVTSWGQDTILCIDSLSFLAKAAFNRVLALVGRRLGGEQGKDAPQQSDWGRAMNDVESLLGLLYSDQIKCHIIITTHISWQGGEEGSGQPVTGYPSALGKALPPLIPRYFNTVLGVDKTGFGKGAKRVIRTIPLANISIKSEIPGAPAELPLESGLADFFRLAGKLPINLK